MCTRKYGHKMVLGSQDFRPMSEGSLRAVLFFWRVSACGRVARTEKMMPCASSITRVLLVGLAAPLDEVLVGKLITPAVHSFA